MVTKALVTSPMLCLMSMLVLQPSTSTMMCGERGGTFSPFGDNAGTGRLGVSLVGICVAVSVGVFVGSSGVFVMVTITGVGVYMAGVMVGGGAGKVDTL